MVVVVVLVVAMVMVKAMAVTLPTKLDMVAMVVITTAMPKTMCR